MSSNLPAGQATVTVNTGGWNIVTFQDPRVPIPSAGFLQICKVAVARIEAGTNFVFMVAGTPVTVPAGPPPQGSCSAAFTQAAGPQPSQKPCYPVQFGGRHYFAKRIAVRQRSVRGCGRRIRPERRANHRHFRRHDSGRPPDTGFLQICKVTALALSWEQTSHSRLRERRLRLRVVRRGAFAVRHCLRRPVP